MSDVREQLVQAIQGGARLAHRGDAELFADVILARFEVTAKDVIADSLLGSMIENTRGMSNHGSAGWNLKQQLDSAGLRIVRVEEVQS